MKKLLLGVLTGVLVLSTASIQVSAACHGSGRHAGSHGCTVTDTSDCMFNVFDVFHAKLIKKAVKGN